MVYRALKEIGLDIGPTFTLYQNDIFYTSVDNIIQIDYTSTDFNGIKKRASLELSNKRRMNMVQIKNSGWYNYETAIGMGYIEDCTLQYNRDALIENIINILL